MARCVLPARVTKALPTLVEAVKRVCGDMSKTYSHTSDRLLPMNPRHLRYFVAVVDHHGVGRAASALRIAQPSLSQAIRQLEQELNTPLFERVGRNLVLSEAGRALLGPARQVLQDLAAATESVAAVSGLATGSVRIVALPSLCLDPVPAAIAVFRKHHPRLTVAADVVFESGDVVDAVRTAQADVGLAIDVRESGALECRDIGEIEISLAFPPGLPVPSKRRISLEAFRGLPFIAGVPGTRTRAVLDKARYAGIEVHVVAEILNRDMVVPLVLQGVGCALVAPPYAEAARQGGATIIGLDPPVTYPVQLLHRSGPLAPATGAFLRTIAGWSEVESCADKDGLRA